MKTYKATFWRSNPQLKNGGYETQYNIEAETKAGARKQAREYERRCVYGSLTLRTIEEVTE